MRGRLLIINPPDLRRYQGLYDALRGLGWKTVVHDMKGSALIEWYARLLSFRPGLSRWKRNYLRISNQLCRTPLLFRYRSWLCATALARKVAECDVVLQTGGLFVHFRAAPRAPYAIFCDCTVKLGEGEPLSGVDFPSARTANRWYELEGLLYRKAGFLFPTSRMVRRSLIEHYGVDGDKVAVVGSAANLNAADVLERDYNSRTILYVGYDFERKGGPILLEAFKKVIREIPEAQLWIAGPRRLEYSLPEGARLLGPLSPPQLSQAYLQASIFVMPSLFEPFAISFLEAMDHGLPCIGSDRCAMPEMIIDGQTGFLAPAGDSETLARQIAYLLRRPGLMREMGARARERVRREFTWPAVARRMDEKLLELSASRRGRQQSAMPGVARLLEPKTTCLGALRTES